MALGLALHARRGPLPRAAGDVLGDALWAAMVHFWISAAVPRVGLATRAGAAVALAWLVEAGQLVRAPWLVALRATRVGHLVLGADFDVRDLAAYALGVAAALVLERFLAARHSAKISGIADSAQR